MKNFMKWLVLNSVQWAVILAGTMSGQQGWYNVMVAMVILVTFSVLCVCNSKVSKIFRDRIRGQLLSPYWVAANGISDWGKFWVLAWFGHWLLAILVVIEISCNEWQRFVAKRENEQGEGNGQS